MTTNNSLSCLSDAELLNEVKRLAATEREATADLIRSLAEVKARGLHRAMGYSSMFTYCTQVLHLSEHAAFARIAAANDRVERAVVRAIAPERYKLQVTIGVETRLKLRRAQDLLRHTNRSADEAAVIDRALTVLVQQLEKVKYGRTDRPRPTRPSDPGSRYVPAPVRRAVSARDGDRCAAHNAYEAERWFGPLFVRECADGWGLSAVVRSAKGGELGLDQVPL